MQNELAFLQCGAQLHLQPKFGGNARVDGWIKVEMPFPYGLGLVQSCLSVAQEAFGVLPITREQSDAAMGRYPRQLLTRGKRTCQGSQQAIMQHHGRVGCLRQIGNCNSKCVSTKPRQNERLSKLSIPALRYLSKHFVAGMPSKRVVHLLEMIKVKHDNGQRLSVMPSDVYKLTESIEK